MKGFVNYSILNNFVFVGTKIISIFMKIIFRFVYSLHQKQRESNFVANCVSLMLCD